MSRGHVAPQHYHHFCFFYHYYYDYYYCYHWCEGGGEVAILWIVPNKLDSGQPSVDTNNIFIWSSYKSLRAQLTGLSLSLFLSCYQGNNYRANNSVNWKAATFLEAKTNKIASN